MDQKLLLAKEMTVAALFFRPVVTGGLG